jgi:hypothetical protein
MLRVVEQLTRQPFSVWCHCGSERMRYVAELAREATSEPTDALAGFNHIAPCELAIAKQLDCESVSDRANRLHQI